MCASGDIIDILRFTSTPQRRPVAVRISKVGSRLLPSLSALAWDQIVVLLAFFEDEMKHIEINTGQAQDEKSQAKGEKDR